MLNKPKKILIKRIASPLSFILLFNTLNTHNAFASNTIYNKVDLLSLYDIAKSNNPTYLQQQAKVNSSLENIGIYKSYLFPQLSGSGAYQYSNSSSNSSFNKNTNNHTTSYSLSLSQALFDLNAYQNYQAVKILGGSAESTDKASYQKMLSDLINAYLLAAQDEALINIYKQQLQQSEKTLTLTQGLFHSGHSASYDISQAKASYLSIHQTLLQAEQKFRTDKYALEKITGKPLYISSFKVLKSSFPKFDIHKKSVGGLLYDSYHNNPIIIVDNIKLESQRKTISANRASHFPTVSLNASYGRQHYGGDLSGVTRTDTASVGVTLSLPIYSGGIISHQVKQQAYNYADYQQQLYIDQQNIRDVIKSSLSNLKIGEQIREIDLENLKVQKQAYDDTLTAYKSGKSGVQIFQVLQAQNYVLSANQTQINNLYNYALSEIQLKLALGKLSEKDIKTLNSYLV